MSVPRFSNETLWKIICSLASSLVTLGITFGAAHIGYMKDAATKADVDNKVAATRAETNQQLEKAWEATERAIAKAMENSPYMKDRSLLASQLADISDGLDDFRKDMKAEIKTLREGQSTLIERVAKMEGNRKAGGS